MWNRNIDTGKWSDDVDVISKDNYDNIKQDLDKVRLYSKCLSGSTYLLINNTDNIYSVLDNNYNKTWYINVPESSFVIPNRPQTLNASNAEEFYNKNSYEYGLTLKNHFTPGKILKDVIKNYIEIDVATTKFIDNIGDISINLIVDGIRLKNGHMILIKDQKSYITLSINIDPEVYFSTVIKAANYYVVESTTLDITYYYYNQYNGVYKYDNNKLVRDDNFLQTYDDSYKFSIVAKLGDKNKDLQFHLNRLKDGYYPMVTENENLEFVENHNRILRNRVDYNNIFDINYYDIITHATQSYTTSTFSYIIPHRTISVGEFGVIINNQDSFTFSYNISHIIPNKYKVNLKSISEVNGFYWVCGDSGTLLKISKVDFNIERIDISEINNFTSVSFYDNLRGIVVGKFNTIYYTIDGGYNWKKILFNDLDQYSYNKVIYYTFNNAYIGGENGIFIDINYTNNDWVVYKRKIKKNVSDDEFLLVEDINDMIKINKGYINGYTYSRDEDSADFGESLKYINNYDPYTKLLTISILSDIDYLGSDIAISFKISDGTGNILYQNLNYGYPFNLSLNSYDIYYGSSYSNLSFTFSVPILNNDIIEDNFRIDISSFYNYDYTILGTSSTYFQLDHYYDITSHKIPLLLMVTNDDNIIAYDIDNNISTNDFLYFSFTQSHSDIRSLTIRDNLNDIFISGDGLYQFPLNDIFNITSDSNTIESISSLVSVSNLELFYNPNKLFNYFDKLYLCGNNSLLEYSDYIDFYELDPNYLDKLKSRLLFLDYDIASKLNFFDDNHIYRLPDSIIFSTIYAMSATGSLSVNSYIDEYNWIDYYKDSIKTFRHNSSMNDSNVVEFSSTFSYSSSILNLSFTGNDIDMSTSSISQLSPTILSSTSSRYIYSPGTSSVITSTYSIFAYKYLFIIKTLTSDSTSIGDVIRITSNVIDHNLIVNRIESVNTTSGYRKFIYCYSDFNNGILNDLKLCGSIKINNLNKYNSQIMLSDNFNIHPIGTGYNLIFDKPNNNFILNPLFNNFTAYYNMQTQVVTGTHSLSMNYEDRFMNFGYSPIYSILDYLNNINSDIFVPSKIMSSMPIYVSMIGNNGSSLTNSVVYIDSNSISNKIIFGSDYSFHWKSIWINTFVDLVLYGSITYLFEKMLVYKKYYDSDIDGYVIEFHKKIDIPIGEYINSFDIVSRNTLDKISVDLQTLNNIQHDTNSKSIQNLQSFVNFDSDLNFKINTDSYCKILLSDYDIKNELSGIIYIDDKDSLSMNVINLDREINTDIVTTNSYTDLSRGIVNKLLVTCDSPHNLKDDDGVILEFNGGTGSSEELNQSYFGFQTISKIDDYQFYTTRDYGYHYTSSIDSGVVRFVRKDPFFNYQPIDIFDVGIDKDPTISVEIKPENLQLIGKKYNLINLDFKNYKFRFVDGLSLSEVSLKYSWILESEVSDAIIGRDENGLIWYSGTWICGRWFGGTWHSGKWISGDWYAGTWNSLNIKYKVIHVDVDTSYVDDKISKWYSGRWFDGIWNGGTWYSGRRYDGNWNRGIWYNGIWNDGIWNDGKFFGGIWIQGVWNKGVFNCNNKPSYWLDGQFNSGDFENGIWYNGQFGGFTHSQSRFGIKSSNSRTSTWNGGKWISGQFHSLLNLDDFGNPTVSNIHKYSIWKTGIWNSGDWYGGVAYNIDFRSGIWHGGILDDIQIIGISSILPASTSRNEITLNGIYRFNIGDVVWIIDNESSTPYNLLGSNYTPMRYLISNISIDDTQDQTNIKLLYNLSTLGINASYSYLTQSNVDTGLKVVSYFKNSTWESGIWTNGIFDSGNFNSGIWYNGIFANGDWGN